MWASPGEENQVFSPSAVMFTSDRVPETRVRHDPGWVR
jgi:hypothetical protein